MPQLIRTAEGQDPLAEVVSRLREAAEPGLADWAAGLAQPSPEADALRAILGNSPFLAQTIASEPGFFRELMEDGPDAAFSRVILDIKDKVTRETNEASLALALRTARRRAALAIALADLTVHWSLERVTQALSDLADVALSAAISYLLAAAHEKGEIVLADRLFPERGCGYVVLAMGKGGARELNYSSDIDLIALYDPAIVDYRGTRSVQQFFVGLTQKLGRLIHDRIDDGYVFRVDWRLRPDPSSTPIALSIASARTYYTDRGETWERAAMIKARPAAGDLALGHAFLNSLTPFVWPDRVDFWTLREIRQLKQRINALRGGREIDFFGHNIKIGRGGIREIEFGAQTQQLIYGGTDPYLRCHKTLDALSTLSEAGYLDEKSADELTEAYEFLRQLEHRLQVINDEQTQTLPSNDADMARLAGFMGFHEIGSFRDTVFHHLRRVAHHYDVMFEGADEDQSGDWDFSAETPSDGMTQALAQAGFSDPAGLYAMFRRWIRAAQKSKADGRGPRALHSLLPRIMAATRSYAAKDELMRRLDQFMVGLDGDQISIALLATNQSALDIVTAAAARAPAILRLLGEKPHLLEHVVEREFSLPPADRKLMLRDVRTILAGSTGEARVARLAGLADRIRTQVGIASVRFALPATDAAHAIADFTDAMILGIDAPFVAIGRYGGRDMQRLDLSDVVLVVDGERDRAEHLRALIVMQFRQIASDSGSSGSPVVLSPGDLGELPTDDHGLTIRLKFASARLVQDRESHDTSMLIDLHRRFATTDGLDGALARLVGTRHAAVQRAGLDAEALTADPRGTPGGLDDIDLLTRATQLREARRFPDVLGLSTATALDRFQAIELWPSHTIRDLRRAHFQLRQIESYREFAIAGERLCDAEKQEVDKALVVAVGANDRRDLMSLLETAASAVAAAFDQSCRL
jgi:glutamate-ammonia-ligase adenylyltransferase